MLECSFSYCPLPNEAKFLMRNNDKHSSFFKIDTRSLNVLTLSLIKVKRSPSRQMYNMVFARFQHLVLKNFRRSWYRYISTEDLIPIKEAWPERLQFRLQDATEVELAKMKAS
jgi:hypothetical protein